MDQTAEMEKDAEIQAADIDPQRRIAELEEQAKALMAEIVRLKKTIIDWHSAMFGALNLILKPHKFNLEIEREYLLNLMPTRIDCLVVKKDSTIPIDLDAFRLFRKYNVVELKSYEDELDIDVIWQTVTYATQYMSQEHHRWERSPEDMTMTILRASYPRALFRELKQHGWQIEEKYRNIYYLSSFIDIPIQVIVTKNLDEEYLPLRILTGRAKEPDVLKFVEYRGNLTEKEDKAYADAVMWACAEANRDLFRKFQEDEKMQGVLREIMHDELVKERQEGVREAKVDFVERMINAGRPGDEISLFTALGRQDIDAIASKLKQKVSWCAG